ncbi:hypothetical protein ACHWQZ_G003445 [Mnemiopsis leidyi]
MGNEKADELAKKGSGDNEAESVTLPVPRTVWKNALRQRSHRKMRERLCRLDREESPALVRHAFAEQKNLNFDWFNVLSTTLNSLDENRHEQQFVNATLCRNRAKDRFISVWQSERQHNRKLRFYNEIKDTFELKPYRNGTVQKQVRKLSRPIMRLFLLRNCHNGAYGPPARRGSNSGGRNSLPQDLPPLSHQQDKPSGPSKVTLDV